MSPKNLSDPELLRQTQNLVQKERALLSEILHHLKEVERRKLYSDLGYGSLFEYCLRELKYSEGQAGRRIQAMKLLRDLPLSEQQKVEKKIESGALNLSHICQAQSFFTQASKVADGAKLDQKAKLQVLSELENKSARQSQALLLEKSAQIGVSQLLPQERERVLSEEHSELRLVISRELRQKLEQVRSLLGPKGLGMSWAELMAAMADLSLESLQDKKFGKRREIIASAKPCAKAQAKKPRSLSKSQKWRVWKRDGDACVNCGSDRNLQLDHRMPVAKGGGAEESNLRLLCSNCNLREGIKNFGLASMRR